MQASSDSFIRRKMRANRRQASPHHWSGVRSARRNTALAAREAGAAVLLVSEDLDELLELADRIVVMFHRAIVHETTADKADIGVIGRAMAGHTDALPEAA